MKKILTSVIPVLLIISCFFLNACKKDQLTIEQEKEFIQVDWKRTSNDVFDNPFTLNLQPNGIADILPYGDIVWRGTYKISGSSLKVVADNQTYKFEIISETEIKLKESGLLLRLRE